MPDYLMLVPKALADALTPLADHRQKQGFAVDLRDTESIFARRAGGEARPEALAEEIRAEATRKGSRLGWVLLAGDPFAGVPAFLSRAAPWATEIGRGESYPSDHAFAAGEAATLAVGRLPARTAQELSLLVDKTLRYEREPGGAWQRRALVFGGPADFGPVADGLIESQAATLLDQLLPYDFDLGVMFAKADSPYAYRFDQLGRKLVEELNAGALVAVYAGHGEPKHFDNARFRGQRYRIGDRADLMSIDIAAGSPLFISLTCLTGDYGAPDGERSVAETMLLRPRGPVAVFASSGVSHPYPNLLYARTMLDQLFVKKAATLGEAVFGAKRAMLEASLPFASLLVPGDHDSIKRSHLELYNLLGDPALKLRLPLTASVELGAPVVARGAPIPVKLVAALPAGDVLLTLETERVELKAGIVTDLDPLPLDQAFEAMQKNHALANDKVISAARADLVDGKASATLTAPDRAGRYVVKALVKGKETAAGHARVRVE